MESLEFSGKSVEEAIQKALKELGLKREEVDITVLHKGKAGFLGLGGEEARIKITPKPSDLATKAKEVLENILSAMYFPAAVHPSSPPQGLGPGPRPLTLDIRGEELGQLIGRRGQTLAALQYIVNLILSHQLKVRTRVLVDVGGYKRRRYRSLRQLALRLAEEVKATGKAITLEPMPAVERRIIHLALSNHPDVTTESIGEGENRKVVIYKRG
jgi:spoIIIJ-associated protein